MLKVSLPFFVNFYTLANVFLGSFRIEQNHLELQTIYLIFIEIALKKWRKVFGKLYIGKCEFVKYKI
jgi:hypothetical protein